MKIRIYTTEELYARLGPSTLVDEAQQVICEIMNFGADQVVYGSYKLDAKGTNFASDILQAVRLEVEIAAIKSELEPIVLLLDDRLLDEDFYRLSDLVMAARENLRRPWSEITATAPQYQNDTHFAVGMSLILAIKWGTYEMRCVTSNTGGSPKHAAVLLPRPQPAVSATVH